MLPLRIFTFLLLFPVLLLNSQQDSCRLRLIAAESFIGKDYLRMPLLSLEQMKQVAPNSKLLQYDLIDEYSASYTKNRSLIGNAAAEFSPYNNRKNRYSTNSTIRTALQAEKIWAYGDAYQNYSTKRFDSVDVFVFSGGYWSSGDTTQAPPPQGTPDTANVDSVKWERRSFMWRSTILSIGIDQVFQTNRDKLISIGTGYGLQVGIGIKNRVDIDYMNWQFIDTTLNDYTGMHYIPEGMGPSVSEHESFKTKPVFSLRIYAPFFMQIRYPQTASFWNHFALTCEYRLGYAIQTFPELGTSAHSYQSFSGGLKYYLR